MDSIHSNFKNPPVSHRAAPLWVWNDLMSEEQIAFQLRELKEHGFGGAFVHPRPGLITDYLSDEWFDRWDFALKTAKELGLKLYIYDENSYPSGFAGGEVSAQLPDCLACGMNYTVIDLSQCRQERKIHDMLPSDDPIAVFTCREGENGLEILEDISVYPKDKWAEHGDMVFVCNLVKPGTTGWLAGFSFVDLMRPEVNEAFIKSTHEKYYARFGDDFGGAIPALFTDEPALYAGSLYGGGEPSVPFSYWFVNEFEKLNGYSLLKNLPCVFKNVTGKCFDHPAEKVRFDYYRTIHHLWTKNSIEPSGKWCAEHNIAFTGHYLEHEWPHVGSNTSPSLQSNYEYHQWPAIDMLLSNYLRNEETHALTLTIQEIRSAANQFGKERTLCELYGAGGWDSTFEDYKRMGDWVMVNGINFINQHLTYATIAGVRKKDHPQSFDWRQPWWNQYTEMNDYIGRVSYMLSQGRMEQRILVLNPSTTGYLVPYEDEKGGIFSDGGFDAIKNPDMHNFLEMVQRLADGQWDYDYGDEFTMERHAKVAGKKLELVKQAYDVVIVSGDMKNMLASTVATLGNFMAAGGKVIAVGEPGNYVDGEVNAQAYAELAKMWESCDLNALDARLEQLLGRRVVSSTPIPAGMTHMRRVLDDGRQVYFFVNHSFTAYSGKLTLPGDSVCEYRLYSGDVAPVKYTAAEGCVSFDMELVRNQSVMLVVGEKAEGKYASGAADTEAALELVSISREAPNVMPVGYCDLEISGRRYENIATNVAADTVFVHRGFQKNPWDNKVQYHFNIMDRNSRYGDDSGFTAAYHFSVAEGFRPAHIDVTAEQYTLCRLNVNGTDVAWIEGEHYLDEHFGVADITPFIRDGLNTVTVIVDKFDVRMELEPIYLRGDFSVITDGDKWIIDRPEALGMGPWRAQKLPFYPYAVNYEYTAQLAEKPAAATLGLGEYDATAVSAIVNGTEVLLNADGKRPQDIAGLLKEGSNRIVIRVCGSMKNLLGPHFNASGIRGSAWPGMWKNAPVNEPKPDAYDLMDWGLKTAPILKTGK